MTADNVFSYTQQAVALATGVADCRRLLLQEQGPLYSACTPHFHFPSCEIRTALCERKHKLYDTGDIDVGGTEAGRNDVTLEWEAFLKRIVRSLQS